MLGYKEAKRDWCIQCNSLGLGTDLAVVVVSKRRICGLITPRLRRSAPPRPAAQGRRAAAHNLREAFAGAWRLLASDGPRQPPLAAPRRGWCRWGTEPMQSVVVD